MKKKKRKAGRVISTLIMLAVFLAGAGLLAYPYVSDAWNKYLNMRLTRQYEIKNKEIPSAEIEKIFRDAEMYNKAHPQNTIVDAFGKEAKDGTELPYAAMLNPGGNGMMGSLVIPKIQVNLPIFHGTGEKTLEQGVGHLQGTSLPIGGKGTHAVLSAHRGLPTAKLFTDLDQLKEGDEFYLLILNRKMAYQVDQIKVVLPDQTADLEIDPDQDYVTLLTCTPYAVNTHRLLVRGHRVPYNEKTDPAKIRKVTDDFKRRWLMIGGAALAAILTFIIVQILKHRKKKQERARKAR